MVPESVSRSPPAIFYELVVIVVTRGVGKTWAAWDGREGLAGAITGRIVAVEVFLYGRNWSCWRTISEAGAEELISPVIAECVKRGISTEVRVQDLISPSGFIIVVELGEKSTGSVFVLNLLQSLPILEICIRKNKRISWSDRSGRIPGEPSESH